MSIFIFFTGVLNIILSAVLHKDPTIGFIIMMGGLIMSKLDEEGNETSNKML